VARELDAFSRHAIEMGRLDDFLSEAPEITVAQVISEDENDIGLLG